MTDHGVVPVQRSSVLTALAGVLTLGAGLVHAAAAGTHDGDSQLAVLFAVVAVVQVVLGAALAIRPGKSGLAAAALFNVAVGGAWLVSRLTGLPLVAGLEDPQPVGLQDVTATVLEVVAAGAAALAFRQKESLAAPRLSPVWALALVPALVGMTAPHSHPTRPDGQHHAEAGGNVTLVQDPVFAGIDTSHASQTQLEAAKALIISTRHSVLEAFPDEAAVVAAGYLSIGDGRFPGTYEHFVRADYLSDGKELDPTRVESIVLENTGRGKRVASAMYILELGKTMTAVPDLAGELTVWHDHQNLCWDDAGVRLAGLLLNGRCVPRGAFRPTPPMLHVWLQDHECGPFAGIEGHGAGCTTHHAN